MKKIIVGLLFLTSAAFAVNVNDPWAPGPNGLQLGSATSGNFVGTLAAGNGISTTGAATGENIAHSVSVNQDYNFNMTGNFTCTPAGTDDINLVTDSDSNLIITGMTDVSGDAVCMSAGNVAGTCAAAVFTTSVSSPALLSPASGGADDITLSPATVTGLTVAEAGQVQINRVVSSHSACAAAGDRGKIEVYSVGDTVSFCGCWQSGVATYAWVGLHVGASC